MLSGLLFAILFEAPLAATAVAGTAVSIPILIHLLNRRRFKIVEWAAMRFLLAAQKKSARKMRIEQLLLLAVRCLVLLLLVLAMCSVTPWAESLWRWWDPHGGKGIANGSTRTHKIIVLDGSYSMGAKSGDGTAFEKARALAQQIVEQGVSGDGFSVVLMASPPRRIVPEPSVDARRVAAEIRNTRATHGNADLAGTLSTVAGLLRASPGKFPAKEVYFLTDMQRSTWQPPRPGDVAGAIAAFKKTGAKAIFVDAGQEGLSNLAVTRLALGDPVATTATASSILATVYNYGETQEVALKLSIGRAREKAGDRKMELREIDTRRVLARAGQQTPVAFAYRFPEPGDYVLRVEAPRDALAVDDARTAIVRVRDEVPVLIVNGKPAPELFDRAGELLRIALDPADEGERPPPNITARPKVVSTAQFADAATGDLAAYDAVFLADVRSLGSDEVRRLEAHVRRGGAVVFSAGDNVADNLAAWNERLWNGGKGLLPAQLVGRARAPKGWAFQLQVPPEGDRFDPLRLFSDGEARERLLQPLFTDFLRTRPLKAVQGEMPRVVLGFAPLKVGKAAFAAQPPAGGPAMIEWRPPLPGKLAGDESKGERRNVSGRGRVVLITTTLNSDWGAWPASPAFPPLMTEVLNHAAAARLRERALLVGEPMEIHLGAMAANAEARVDAPRDVLEERGGDDEAKTVLVVPRGDGSVMRCVDTDVSGLYRATIGGSPKEYFFTVNPPAATEDQSASESNLARIGREELEQAYPDWDLQVVAGLDQVRHATPEAADASETVYAPQGPPIARVLLLLVLGLVLLEVVLAWRFGHYSATGALPNEAPKAAPGLKEYALWTAPWVLLACLAGTAFVLAHDALTGDFLGFAPEGFRTFVERSMDVPPPAAGEGSRWRLEYSSFFHDAKADPWLAGILLVLAGLGIAWIYWQEGNDVPGRFRALLLSLRLGILFLMLAVFLPQLRLYFERQGWPDVVLLLDDSYSMSTLDHYRSARTRQAADALAEKASLGEEEKSEIAKLVAAKEGLTRASRLRLAQTLLAHDEQWLREALARRKVRLHVYRFASRAQRVADVSGPAEVERAADAIRALRPDPRHDSTQVGTAIRQVLNDFRGSSLSAVVVLTDGASTEGEPLERVAKYADSLNVPLLFVGIGDTQEKRDLYLHDLQAEGSVRVNDRVEFKVKVTAQGFSGLTVPVSLYEKGKETPLETKQVTIPEGKRSEEVRLYHRPKEVGKKRYVVRVPVQEGETDAKNNQAEKKVVVAESKVLRVLYVEGYRRYEYHYLKTLLERESARVKGNKTIDLKVLLLDADPEFAESDRTALAAFPTPFRGSDTHTDKNDLWSYDVIVLGDIDPDPRGDRSKVAQGLKDVAEWVEQRGGGLLVLGGERFSPAAFRTTALKDVLPLDVEGEPEAENDEGILETYRLEITPAGRRHSIFRLKRDDKENEEVWARLKPFYWHAQGYVPKRAAEVLATHPSAKGTGKASGQLQPLVLQQYSGLGRCMFFGFDETWRWNWRDDQEHYNTFWNGVIRYMARSKQNLLELALDRQTPYRRGDPIKMIVRFPEDEKPPPKDTEVKVMVERSPFGKLNDKQTRTVKLAYVKDSRGTWEGILDQTPEGDYRFVLTDPLPKDGERPEATATVLAPPGEMDSLRMEEDKMKRAADLSHGRFYSLDEAGRLLDELPAGNRVTVNAPGPPMVVWNSWLLFLLALGLFTVEWLLRKTKNLL